MQDSSPFDQVLLGCAPLVDREREVFGLRLNVFPVGPQVPAQSLLAELAKAVAPRVAVPGREDAPVLLSLHNVALLDAALAQGVGEPLVIEVPGELAGDAERASAIRGFYARGGSLAVSGHAWTALPKDVLPCFGHVVEEAATRCDPARFKALAPDAALILAGLETTEQAELALRSGVRSVVGWPLDPVTSSAAAAVNPELKGVLELMDLVEREESLDAMERVLKGDPTLAFRLLRLINSAAFGLRVEITSFRHALMLLGHERLKRWLALLLVSASRDAQARPLVHLAVRRAFLMEHLAKAMGLAEERDEMFVCGLFSLLDRLMKQPLSTLLGQVPMPARVQVSLKEAAGPYSKHLRLLLAIEQAAAEDLREASQAVGVPAAALASATLSAVAAVAELAV